MDKYWTIRPKQGLGPLEFGMTPEQAGEFNEVFGKAELAPTGGASGSTLDETLAQFSQFFSEEDLKAAKAELEKQPPSGALRLEIYPDKGLSLEYSQNSLSVVQIMAEADLTNIDNVEIFKISPSEVLKLIESKNGAPGLFKSTQALFRNIAVSLDSFSVVERGDQPQPMPSFDERYGGRNIELRAKAYLPEEEAGQFVSFSFL